MLKPKVVKEGPKLRNGLFFNTMMFLKDVMIPRKSSGNLPLTYDENELSPSNLSNATLEDVDSTEGSEHCQSSSMSFQSYLTFTNRISII